MLVVLVPAGRRARGRNQIHVERELRRGLDIGISLGRVLRNERNTIARTDDDRSRQALSAGDRGAVRAVAAAADRLGALIRGVHERIAHARGHAWKAGSGAEFDAPARRAPEVLEEAE